MALWHHGWRAMTVDELSCSGFARAIAVSELASGKPLHVTLPSGPAIIVLTTGDTNEIVAFSPLCPHQLGNLATGTWANGRISCPVHDYEFDVLSGACVLPRGEAMHLRKYEVAVSAGDLWIKIPRPKWRRD